MVELNKPKKVLAIPQGYGIIYTMKSLSYYDSSYSPNEACEQNNDYMDCGACYDTGMIVEEDVYCDCIHGNARIGHDMEDALIEPMPNDEQLEKLYDNYKAYGEC